jgi:hypothetical protein
MNRFYYDASSPTYLRWAVDVYRGKTKNIRFRSIGDQAGSTSTRYANVSWTEDGKTKQAACHRVVWFLHHGVLSAKERVDHIDGDTANNAITNLRLVTAKGNSRNRKKDIRNKSGITGVSFSTVRGYGYWVASWTTDAGLKKTKAFSVAKLGEGGARLAATTLRIDMLRAINSTSMTPYTNRHMEI